MGWVFLVTCWIQWALFLYFSHWTAAGLAGAVSRGRYCRHHHSRLPGLTPHRISQRTQKIHLVLWLHPLLHNTWRRPPQPARPGADTRGQWVIQSHTQTQTSVWIKPEENTKNSQSGSPMNDNEYWLALCRVQLFLSEWYAAVYTISTLQQPLFSLRLLLYFLSLFNLPPTPSDLLFISPLLCLFKRNWFICFQAFWHLQPSCSMDKYKTSATPSSSYTCTQSYRQVNTIAHRQTDKQLLPTSNYRVGKGY